MPTTEDKNMEQLKKETARILKLDSEEKEGKEILDNWPLQIISIDLENSVWSKIQEYHKIHYNYYFLYKNDRMFVYHLGMANLAEHISEVKKINIEAFQQRLVYLQFGKDYPDIVSGFHRVIYYQQCFKCEKDFVSEIKDVIKDTGKNEKVPGVNITDGEWGTLTNQYVDGCIRILADLLIPYAYNDGVIFDKIPKEFDEKRNRYKKLGDFIDDYLTKINP